MDTLGVLAEQQEENLARNPTLSCASYRYTGKAERQTREEPQIQREPAGTK